MRRSRFQAGDNGDAVRLRKGIPRIKVLVVLLDTCAFGGKGIRSHRKQHCCAAGSILSQKTVNPNKVSMKSSCAGNLEDAICRSGMV